MELLAASLCFVLDRFFLSYVLAESDWGRFAAEQREKEREGSTREKRGSNTTLTTLWLDLLRRGKVSLDWIGLMLPASFRSIPFFTQLTFQPSPASFAGCSLLVRWFGSDFAKEIRVKNYGRFDSGRLSSHRTERGNCKVFIGIDALSSFRLSSSSSFSFPAKIRKEEEESFLFIDF